MEIQVGEYVSRKDYLKKYDSNVGYALHVQNSIKKDDYARLNTGKIVKVIGIKENNINKKAIYYGVYKTDWFDSSAVENFSADIIDLIEIGDYVNGHKIEQIWEDAEHYRLAGCNYMFQITDDEIKSIVTKEQFESMEYKVRRVNKE